MPSANQLFHRLTPWIQQRCLHLDLKGMPPTSKRLLQLPGIFEMLRINAVLVEWEDTYPWEWHPPLRSPTAYSKRTVQKFIQDLTARGIEVIPLVQCLGHAENILLKKKFARLREHKDSAGELCPMRRESTAVVIRMIEDMLATHGGYIRRVHIGGDEPWTFGSCPQCRDFIRRHGKAALYFRHIDPILNYLNKRNLKAVLWDDEIREWPMPMLRALSKRIELCVWQYNPDIFGGSFPPLKRSHLRRYTTAGIQWSGAPAFKRTGDGDLPDTTKCLANIGSWVRVLQDYPQSGMVATGWSRGDFCARAQCGLEPAWDMIVMTAALMWDGALPKNHVELTANYLRKGPLAKLVGKSFSACYRSSLEFDKWNRELSISRLWNQLEQAASVSLEPERFNLYTFKRFHGFDELQRRLRCGIALGKSFIRAHQGLVPDRWLKLYANARINHHWQRLEQLVRPVLHFYPDSFGETWGR